MKRRLTALAAAMALFFCAKAVYASEVSLAERIGNEERAEWVEQTGDPDEEGTEGDSATTYSVTVQFKSNGGTGTMESLNVSSDMAAAKLTPNAFQKTGFSFVGWNTQKDGSGVSYLDQADALPFASVENNGKKVTLYAQWKLNAPAITKVKKATPGTIKVTFKPAAGVDGYEIQYSIDKKFNKKKNIRKKVVDKKEKSVELVNTTPGKVHYVRMRSYSSAGDIYSDWTKVTSKTKIKLKKVSTISNTKSVLSMEADVVLTGSGTGYHAKLVMGTSQAAVSYGIQYDSCAVAPYTGKAVTLIENVASNAPGGQTYIRPSGKSLTRGKKYHLMMTLDDYKGNGSVYLNYKKIGSFHNENLAKKNLHASDPVTLRVEGSARLNGDSVKATFSNIRCKENGKFDENRKWGILKYITNKTMKIKFKKDGSIILHGKISGLPGGGDWDSMYNDVSAVCRLY